MNLEKDEIDPGVKKSPIRAKWKTALDAGFVVVPSVLLRRQGQLGISDGELVVLQHLMMAWWEQRSLPFTRPHVIAARSGGNVRTVQRHLSALEKRGVLIRRREDRGLTKYDLSPLVLILEKQSATLPKMQTGNPDNPSLSTESA